MVNNRIQKWTLALAAAGLISPGALVKGEEMLHPVLAEVSATTLSGFVDTSAVWQLGTGHTDTARFGDGSDRQDGFNVDLIGITLSKPLSDGGWSSGYVVSLTDGPDVGDRMTFQEAHVKLGVPVGNGLVLKVGTFYSLAGYEYIERYKNPNFSHSYGYFTEPGPQTGVLAEYKFCEGVTVIGGVGDAYSPSWPPALRSTSINKYGVADIDEAKKNIMAAFCLDAPESFGFLKGADLYTAIISGRSRGTPDALGNLVQGSDRTDFSMALTWPTPYQKLTAVVTYDYFSQSANDISVPAGYAPDQHANATALYLIYKPADKFTAANRLNYANGSTGFFGTPVNPSISSDKLLSETLTLSYALWANVITRGEFRWDHDLAGASFGNGGGEKNAFSLAMNVIYLF